MQARIFAEVDTRAIALPDAAHAAKQLKQVARGWSKRNDKRAAARFPAANAASCLSLAGSTPPLFRQFTPHACCAAWPLVRDTLAAEQGH